MGLQFCIRRHEDVVILDLRGRVTIGHSNDELSRELRSLADNEARKILVNLNDVPQLDSSGISTIVRTFVTLRRAGGSLKLLRPTGHVFEVLDMTHLLQTIPTFDDENKALESFREATP
ncbi:MAG: STAS domain-containing protein [Candidatus Acidiferrales bacterium]|jgi:anti-anti-sigma factor